MQLFNGDRRIVHCDFIMAISWLSHTLSIWGELVHIHLSLWEYITGCFYDSYPRKRILIMNISIQGLVRETRIDMNRKGQIPTCLLLPLLPFLIISQTTIHRQTRTDKDTKDKHKFPPPCSSLSPSSPSPVLPHVGVLLRPFEDGPGVIFVIIPHICHFFTRLKFLENKIYTEKRQFFALNL